MWQPTGTINSTSEYTSIKGTLVVNTNANKTAGAAVSYRLLLGIELDWLAFVVDLDAVRLVFWRENHAVVLKKPPLLALGEGLLFLPPLVDVLCQVCNASQRDKRPSQRVSRAYTP